MTKERTWYFKPKKVGLQRCSYCERKGRGFLNIEDTKRHRKVCAKCFIEVFDTYFKAKKKYGKRIKLLLG